MVTASHTGDMFVASVSHVIDQSPTSANNVGDVKQTTPIHGRGMNLVLASHTRIHSPTYTSNVGEFYRTSMSHVEEKQPTTASHAGGIDSIDKSRQI
jgi:hypothetical protein